MKRTAKMAAFVSLAIALTLLCTAAYAQAAASGSFTDPRDGKIYRTVAIGNQTWMAYNLNYKSDSSWCYNNKESFCKKYGRQYTWEAALRACPRGWHLPDTTEMTALINAAGGWEVAGKKLKSKRGWIRCVLVYDHPACVDCVADANGTDDFGFSALPSSVELTSGVDYACSGYGKRWSAAELRDGVNGADDGGGGGGITWWSATAKHVWRDPRSSSSRNEYYECCPSSLYPPRPLKYDGRYAYALRIRYDGDEAYVGGNDKNDLASVRCVMD